MSKGVRLFRVRKARSDELNCDSMSYLRGAGIIYTRKFSGYLIEAVW